MSGHPYRDVAIAAVHDTRQARRAGGLHLSVVADGGSHRRTRRLGLERDSIDGVVAGDSADLIYALGLGPVWSSSTSLGIRAVLNAVEAIAAGASAYVLIVDGAAGVYTDRHSTAPWTRPDERVRRRRRDVHRGGVRFYRSATHAHVRNQTGATRDGVRHHPQQRACEPRGRLLWTGPVSA